MHCLLGQARVGHDHPCRELRWGPCPSHHSPLKQFRELAFRQWTARRDLEDVRLNLESRRCEQTSKPFTTLFFRVLPGASEDGPLFMIVNTSPGPTRRLRGGQLRLALQVGRPTDVPSHRVASTSAVAGIVLVYFPTRILVPLHTSISLAAHDLCVQLNVNCLVCIRTVPQSVLFCCVSAPGQVCSSGSSAGRPFLRCIGEKGDGEGEERERERGRGGGRGRGEGGRRTGGREIERDRAMEQTVDFVDVPMPLGTEQTLDILVLPQTTRKS